MAVFGNKELFWLFVRVSTPGNPDEVDQTMSTDTIDSVINRLESIIIKLKKNKS